MSLCKTNTSDFSPTVYNGTSYSVREAVGINKNGSVKSYGGQTLDMTGNWNWIGNGNVGGKISDYDSIIKNTAKNLNLDWRLCAALCWCESRFNPTIVNENTKATGLWQIIRKFWRTYAPPNCYNDSFLTDPKLSTLGFEKVMRRHLDNNANAETRNDQIALAIQCWHDGSLGGPSPRWYNRRRGKYGSTSESYKYVPRIIRKYKEYCARK